ncbi:MAG: hypothetical protein IJY28_09830 [Clostridia bacterium]|nr:hypothetical protein [Clostridia bacterium]
MQHPHKISNLQKYYAYTILWSILTLVTSGSAAQTFLLEYGLPEDRVTSFFSVMQLIQLATIFFFSRSSDSVKSITGSLTRSHLMDLPYLLLLTVLCFAGFGQGTVYGLLLVAGCIFSVSVGLNNVLSYKLPYQIIDMHDYARFLSVSGALGGICAVIFSVLSHYTQLSLGYFPAMRLIYPIALILWALFMFSTATMKEHPPAAPIQKKDRINLLAYKPFTTLILPNVARGFCQGMVNMSVAIGYYTGQIDAHSANYVIIITHVLTIVGSYFFSVITKHFSDRRLLLACSIGIAATLPFLAMGGTTGFLLVYAVLYFFVLILNNAVPFTLTRVIDYKVMGQYSAGRMLLNTLGNSLAGFLCVPMFRVMGVIPALALSGGLQLLSGIGYYIVLTRMKKAKEASV